MSIKAYLELLAAQLERAEAKMDKDECIRLAHLGRTVLAEYVKTVAASI